MLRQVHHAGEVRLLETGYVLRMFDSCSTDELLLGRNAVIRVDGIRQRHGGFSGPRLRKAIRRED